MRAVLSAGAAFLLALGPGARAQELPAHGGNGRGYALSFQGTLPVAGIRNGVLDFSDPAWGNLAENATIAAWVRWHNVQVYAGVAYRWTTKSDNLLLDLQVGGTWNTLNGELVYFSGLDESEYINVWVHQTQVFSNGRLQGFLNGELVSETVVPGYTLVHDDCTFYLGGLLYTGGPIDKPMKANGVGNMKGDIDDIQVWSKAMNSAEIKALMATQRDVGGDPPPEELVLHYNFDAGACSAGSVSAGLQHPSCAVTGDFIVPNHGATGSKYDLLLGQVNNDFGFGLEWTDTRDPDAVPRRFEFPSLAISSVPPPDGHDPAAFSPAAPRTYLAHPGESVRIPVPPHAAVGLLPGEGQLERESDLSLLVAGESTAGESAVVFRAPASWDVPVWFTLQAGSVTQEVHVRPHRAPTFSQALEPGQTTVDVEMFDDGTATIELRPYVVSTTGELPNAVIVAVPAFGTVLRNTGDGTPQGALGLDDLVLFNETLSVAVQPAKSTVGVPTLKVQFVSPASGLRSPVLTFNLKVISVNSLPVVAGRNANATEDESLEQAPWIDLAVDDGTGTSSVVVSITALPRNGALYMEDGVGGALRRIEEPYNIYDVGSPVHELYVAKVVGVSSYVSGRVGVLVLHGPPRCATFQRLQSAGECNDLDLADESSPLPLGKVVRFARIRGVPHSSITAKGVITNVTVTFNATTGDMIDVYDILIPHSHKYVPLESRDFADLVPCALVTDVEGSRYPDDCSVEEVANHPPEGMTLRDVPRADLDAYGIDPFSFGTTPLGDSWNHYQQPPEPLYGLWFNHSAKAHYAEHGYSEFVEIEIEEEVYPIGVEVGHTRGAGSLVGVKALGPDGEWKTMYHGEPQPEEVRKRKGFYFRFNEAVCRPAFRTRTLRFEFDNSVATGIPDYIDIDFIKVIGALDSQPAMLRQGSSRVKYVPYTDRFGSDSFSFGASDCGGDRLRTALEDAVVNVQVAGIDDPPVIKTDASALASQCGVQGMETLAIELVAVDPDGDSIVVTAPELAASGTLEVVLQDGSTAPVTEAPLHSSPLKPLDGGVSVEQATVRRVQLRYRPACESLKRSTEVKIVAVVHDANGASANITIPVAVLQEDRGLIGDSTRSLGKVMFGINMAFVVAMLVWVVTFRAAPIVRAAQVHFQVMLLVGCAVSSVTILFINVDDRESLEVADRACRWQAWLYCMGWLGTIGPLTVKMLRVRLLFDDNFTSKMAMGTKSEREKSRAMVSDRFLVTVLGAMVLVDAVILLMWSANDPLHFVREPLAVDRASGYVTESMGTCTSDSAATFVTLILVYHLCVLLWLSFIAYKTSHINTAFSEAKYVRIVVISMLQVLVVSVPVMIIASDNATTIAFTRSAVVFLNDFTGVALIFIPKVLMQLFPSFVDHSGAGGEMIRESASKYSRAGGASASKVGTGLQSEGATIVLRSEAGSSLAY